MSDDINFDAAAEPDDGSAAAREAAEDRYLAEHNTWQDWYLGHLADGTATRMAVELIATVRDNQTGTPTSYGPALADLERSSALGAAVATELAAMLWVLLDADGLTDGMLVKMAARSVTR